MKVSKACEISIFNPILHPCLGLFIFLKSFTANPIWWWALLNCINQHCASNTTLWIIVENLVASMTLGIRVMKLEVNKLEHVSFLKKLLTITLKVMSTMLHVILKSSYRNPPVTVSFKRKNSVGDLSGINKYSESSILFFINHWMYQVNQLCIYYHLLFLVFFLLVIHNVISNSVIICYNISIAILLLLHKCFLHSLFSCYENVFYIAWTIICSFDSCFVCPFAKVHGI